MVDLCVRCSSDTDVGNCPGSGRLGSEQFQTSKRTIKERSNKRVVETKGKAGGITVQLLLKTN